MKISPELHEDLSRWLADAESDSPSFEVRTKGLCFYVRNSSELQQIFEKGYLEDKYRSILFPFGGSRIFYNEIDNLRCHLNPQRIAFVKGVLNVT